MNSKEVTAHMHLYRQAMESRAERDTSALARTSLYQHERREAERKARRANRLLVVSVWVLTALVACVTIFSTTFTTN
jgi:hypothetical protein